MLFGVVSHKAQRHALADLLAVTGQGGSGGDGGPGDLANSPGPTTDDGSSGWVGEKMYDMEIGSYPGKRKYNRGGRPGLDVDFKAVHDAVQDAWNGSGETITDIADL